MKKLAVALLIFAFIWCNVMIGSCYCKAEDNGEKIDMPEHYFVRLLGTRESWPEAMTDHETAVMERHYYYLKDLIAKKKVITAGPVFENVFGLIILRVDSKEEALEIMNNEPSVTAGVHTYEISPMVLSLLAHNVPPDRYVSDVSERILHKEKTVPGTAEEVWSIWTTTAGVNSFLSPEAKVEFRIGGPFEIYFNTEAPDGEKGSEDCRFLSYIPNRMISFEWNAPPSFGRLRGQRTQVVIHFEQVEEGKVKVIFDHLGWGKGVDWDKLYDYFDKAWSYVLNNLEKRFIEGPIEWE